MRNTRGYFSCSSRGSSSNLPERSSWLRSQTGGYFIQTSQPRGASPPDPTLPRKPESVACGGGHVTLQPNSCNGDGMNCCRKGSCVCWYWLWHRWRSPIPGPATQESCILTGILARPQELSGKAIGLLLSLASLQTATTSITCPAPADVSARMRPACVTMGQIAMRWQDGSYP